MNLDTEKFSPSALEQISKIIGNRYTGSQITIFFEKCGFPQYAHDGVSTKWRFVNNVLHQLQNSAYGSYNILKIVKNLCNPEEFYGNAEQHREIIKSINEVLEFYGFSVNGKGEIINLQERRTTPNEKENDDAKLFATRNFHHEVMKHSKDLFIKGNYFHAVFESCKAFDKYVREKSGIDKHGTDLMTNALSLKGPLKLNKQITETEKNEQEGLMHLCVGLMRAIRNPESHEPKLDWNISREDALDILSLISFLYRQIDKTIYFNPVSYNRQGGIA
ncbi:TIGR02391 family protein [Thermoanaerobacterium thermosaccharolyticum]|jgi:uncharacterized protein (TIGR02391 family)|uniref:TIGR02391 family protein n=1 Tax=Thermoanaerobacterium thermosaccharolyticum TaxID=1517 RepID=UPI0020A3A702|nr:TIGR02391 family protein [Thermoanaerobacterium thermosaccharolyticum]MCP2240241.1 uncharacterized protein (TIGR02391 family) [Thermoanaerobacterium thermosaccharolyticum]